MNGTLREIITAINETSTEPVYFSIGPCTPKTADVFMARMGDVEMSTPAVYDADKRLIRVQPMVKTTPRPDYVYGVSVLSQAEADQHGLLRS